VYAAIGASETVGDGIGDNALRLRDEWPQLFFNAALPRGSTYVNFGIPGATTQVALEREVPAALTIRPTIVTVWLNVNDLVQGVSAADYEDQLAQLVGQLRQGGRATVLIATTPVLEHLPAYQACVSQSTVNCILGTDAAVPPPDVVVAQVAAYNAAIARVAARERAIVVDLHGQGDIPLLHPDWVASDGLHPSFLGHAQVAILFTAAYRSGRRSA
jgi:lysophospholipase L1-like esterase